MAVYRSGTVNLQRKLGASGLHRGPPF